MALGDDIKEAHQEVGLSFTILRDSGNISGEYAIIQQNRQATKPFIREFFQSAKFGYDTTVDAGDIIQSSDGRHLMVMNKTPTLIMNEIAEYEAVLYKCNVSGELTRFSGEATYNDDYELQAEEVSVKECCYGLLTEFLYGNELEADEELGLLGLQNHELYVPSSYGISVHDRYKVSSDEYYKVETVAKRKYDKVHVAMVGEDNRP